MSGFSKARHSPKHVTAPFTDADLVVGAIVECRWTGSGGYTYPCKILSIDGKNNYTVGLKDDHPSSSSCTPQKHTTRDMIFLVRSPAVVEAGDKLIASIADASEVANILEQTNNDPLVVNYRDCYGTPAIHHCAEKGHLETAKALVAAGANLKHTCSNGWTALGKARIYSHDTQMVNIFGAEYTRVELTALTGASDPRRYAPASEIERAGIIARVEECAHECKVPTVLEYAPQFVRADKAFVLRLCGHVYEMCVEARDSNGIPNLSQFGSFFSLIDASLLDEEDFVINQIGDHAHGAMIFAYCSERLRGMKVVAMKALEHNGNLLKYASEALRADREVVMLAAHHSHLYKSWKGFPGGDDWKSVLSAAAPALQEDMEIISAAIHSYGFELAHVLPHLVDAALVKSVLQGNSQGKGSLKMLAADSPFREDAELVHFAIETISVDELAEASPTLRNNRDLVMFALSRSCEALKYASEELRDDREIVLLAQSSPGSYSGLVSSYASERLRADEEIKSRFDAARTDQEDAEYAYYMR